MRPQSSIAWKYYRGFGLVIRSAFVLPELSETPDHEFDVEILEGEVSFDGGASPERPFRRGFAPGIFYLDVYQQVKFEVTAGNQVIVDRRRQGEEELKELRLYLYGSVMAALLQQRGHVVLHGSAFEWNGGAVVIMGDSGSGKSTTAAVLAQFGHRILTDDVCSVQLKPTDEWIVHPGLRRQKLWGDALVKLGISRAGLEPVKPDMEKFSYPLEQAFCSSALPLTHVFVLGGGAKYGIQLERCTQVDSLRLLLKQSYRVELAKGMGIHTEYFAVLTRLAAKVAVFRLKKSSHIQPVTATAAAIVESLNG